MLRFSRVTSLESFTTKLCVERFQFFIVWLGSLKLLETGLIAAQSAIQCQILHEEFYWEQKKKTGR